MMHYRNERNLTAMLSHPAYFFLQGLVALFSLPFKSLFGRHLLGIFFSPGLGSDKPERMTLGQSVARTDKFISAVKPFYRSRNKELRVYDQQSAYGVNTISKNISRTVCSK